MYKRQEETGLILPLGDWILRQACRQNGEWQAQGYPCLPVSVPVSRLQFRQKELVASIGAIIKETAQPPALLELRIAESTLLLDVEENLTKLRQLADMGVRLAIDGFGTGYSSLTYLKRFPGHSIHIPRSLVRDLGDNREDSAMVAAIFALASALGRKVLVEGVDSDSQLAALMNLGCRNFQGGIFSDPMPPEASPQLFKPAALGLGA